MAKNVKFTAQELRKYGPRFLHMIRVMDEVIANDYAFSLEVFAMEMEFFKEDGHNLGSGKPENSCGTVACMMGWAAFDPWHNKQGLKAKGKKERYVEFEHNNDIEVVIQKYLNISYYDAMKTFFTDENFTSKKVTAKQARRRLINLAQRKGIDVSVVPPLPPYLQRKVKTKIMETENV